jgi:hypothetical protein
MQTQERRPTPAVIFDSSIEDEIGQVLALTMLLGYESKREIRVGSLSVSRNNLKIAVFCSLMGRFFGTSPTIGMAADGPSSTTVPPMIEAVLTKRTEEDKPTYARTISRMNDTADPVALIRNALTAQPDQNSIVILAGPPVNLLGLLALPGSQQLIQKKVRVLVVAAPFKEAEGMKKLLAEWPSPVVSAGEDLGQSLPFPGECIEKDFEWAANHPLIDAYRAAKAMPYDARSTAMAAVLYAIHPEDNFFTLSETSGLPQNRHRQLAANPDSIARIIQAYREAVSTKPPESRRGGPQK